MTKYVKIKDRKEKTAKVEGKPPFNKQQREIYKQALKRTNDFLEERELRQNNDEPVIGGNNQHFILEEEDDKNKEDDCVV